jgi:excisionase family DNA binding protein
MSLSSVNAHLLRIEPGQRQRRRTMKPSHHEVMLTVDELGERLGTGGRFARRLIAERRIRFVKVGRHVRVPTTALEEFIQAATVQPVRIPR